MTDLHEDYILTTGIEFRDSKFDPESSKCENVFPNKFSSPLQKLHLKNQSCDSLFFNMEEREHDFLSAFKFDKDDPISQQLQTSLRNLGYNESSEFTKLMIEIFSMPEPTLPSYFISGNSDDAVFSNSNLVSPTVKENFIGQLETFTKLVKNDFRDSEQGQKVLSSIEKVEASFRQRYPNVDGKNNVKIDLDFQFVRKIDSGAKQIVFFGDIHSSIHTLCRSLLRLNSMGFISEFKLVDKRSRIIFLGDMTDRSLYGPEVFYIVMKLKETNPKQVYINKGNHEDYGLSSRYGFRDEISCKILDRCSMQEANQVHFNIAMIWMYLPVAIFLPIEKTDEHVQFCHGGFIDDVAKIKKFLRDSESTFLTIDAEDAEEALWSDFRCGTQKSAIDNASRGGSTKIYTAEYALEYMEECKIVTLLRGHQESFDNTKLISNRIEDRCNEPVAWEEYLERYPEKFASYLPRTSSDTYSVKFPVPALSSLQRIDLDFFTPVYTMTTAISARSMDADGFGIFVSETSND
jgi:hypothetical protein